MNGGGSSTPSRFAPRGRRAGIALGVILLGNTACYTYAPIASPTPQPGERVAIEITDRGRLSLGDQLGAGVLRVEGLVNENQGNEVLLSVTRVGYINAPSANWSGERIRLASDAIARVQERRFSAPRTLLAASIVAGATAAFFVTRSLIGGGKEDDGPPSRTPPGDSHRIPAFRPGLRLTLP